MKSSVILAYGQKIKTHVEVISNDQHRCIAAGTLAFDFNHSELSVLCRLSGLDTTEVLADGVENIVRSAQHAGCCRADLDKVLAYWLPTNSERAIFSMSIT